MKKIPLIGLLVLNCAVLMAGCGTPSSAELVKAGASDFQLGRLDKARTTMELVLRAEPSHAGALFYMGRICHAERSYPQAVYYYKCCLDVDPGYPEAPKFLRDAQRQLGAMGGEPRFSPDLP